MASTLLQNPKFEELCRLCASKTELVLSVHIFEGEGSMRELNKKIDNCLQLQVHHQDELPKIICEDCLVKLEMFWDFKDRSFRTEELLIELYKGFKNGGSNNENQCVVSIDSNGLILQVPNHQMLTEDLPTDIDISQLSQREHPDNYAIILHHNDLDAHHLQNLELSNHDLTGQDLPNQSIHDTQENLVVLNSSENDERFSQDNLNLMQHQLLNDAQFRLHHELHVSMAGGNSIYTNSLKPDVSQNTEPSYAKEGEDNQSLDTIDYSNQKNSLAVDSNLSDNSLGVEVDSHLNRIISYSSDSQMDHIHNQDESNSNPNILDDQEISNVSAVIAKDSFLLNSDGMDHSNGNEDLTNLSSTYFSCTLCGKTYDSRTDLDTHCQSHFFKYGIETESLSYEENSKNSDIEQKVIHKDELSLDSVDGFRNEDSNSIDNPPTPPDIPDQSDLSNESPLLIDLDNFKQEETHIKPGFKIGSKVCQECGKSYKTNYKLAEHMRKHTGERPYKCKSCDKAFRSKIGLAQHEAKHTGQYDFACPTCGKGFQCKSYLMVHQRVHSDLKPYPCVTCGINFKTKQSLLDHTNRHLGVKPFICSICNRGFITKGLCRAHEKTHTGVDNRKYSCKICQKKFVSKSYLQTHSRIHTGDKPFICEVCGKGFLTRVDLKIHLTMHTGEKSYVCEMCGKAFARRDALKCHRRMHTGERPYRCDVCGRTFTQFTPMANHRRHHTGEKPYSCLTCGKKFVAKSTMVSHAKKHSKKMDNSEKNLAVVDDMKDCKIEFKIEELV